jgi:hypothetical protein
MNGHHLRNNFAQEPFQRIDIGSPLKISHKADNFGIDIAFSLDKLGQFNTDGNGSHYIPELIPPYQILRIFFVHRGYGRSGTAGSGFVAPCDPLINEPHGMPHAVSLPLVPSVNGVHR